MARQRRDDIENLPPDTGSTVGISRVPPPRGRGQHLDPDALSFHPERLTAAGDDEDEESGDDQLDPDAWFVDAGDVLAQAYCVTLVQDVGVDETLTRLAATTSAPTTMSLEDLVEEAYEGPSAEVDQVAGVAQVDGWTLVLEPNGSSCTEEERMRVVSASTTTVTMYTNVNSASKFTVFVDGARLLTFDMLFPEEREGGNPDRFVADMLAAGFVFDPADSEPLDDDEDQNTAVSGARLVERLTGVRLTVGLLDAARYRTGLLASG